MKNIRDIAGQELQWVRTKWWKWEFVLRAGDEELARLSKEKSTGRVIGEASDGCWAFKRRSLWSAEIVVTELDSQAEVAVVRRGRKSGIVFADGRTFTWNKKSFWHNDWDWVDGEGNALVHFQRSKYVVVESFALTLPELSLLVISGWHLLVLRQEEAAAASTAATVG